jgi:hypothetical protein
MEEYSVEIDYAFDQYWLRAGPRMALVNLSRCPWELLKAAHSGYPGLDVVLTPTAAIAIATLAEESID